MTKLNSYGFVKDGVLNLLNRKRFEADLKQFKDCDVEIVVKKRGKRSLPQNRYYFGVVLEEIRIELKRLGTITDIETLHEWAKQKFNAGRTIIEGTGEVIEIGQSTTEFNRTEMTEYIEKIRGWAALSLSLHIPDPGSQGEMFNQENKAA